MDRVRQKIIEKIEQADVYDLAIMTQLQRAKNLSSKLGAHIYFKREDLQLVRSFKIRGAYNRIKNLSEEEKSRGIMAASAGNHAQGVALSAKRLGLSATIVMPATTPEIKVSAVKQYGAEVVLSGDSYSDAADYAKKLRAEKGLTYIHPFDDEDVIAGQGTVAVEILEQLPEVDYVFVPIGGGGLIAGVAAYMKAHKPSVRIIGVEPEDSAAMKKSIDCGRIVNLKHVGIFADGVAVKQVGNNTFEIVRDLVHDIITVSTDEICAAIKDIYLDSRAIVEGAGALGVAGIKKYQHKLKGAHAVAINSGANLTFEELQFIAERTLLGSGNEALYSIELPERPGALKRLVSEVVNGLSISEFNYRKSDAQKANIFVGVVGKSADDKIAFEQRLNKFEYNFVDLTDDDTAKTHVRHMVGGKAPADTSESIYDFGFPERPGALSDFLDALDAKTNISLFHYRHTGGDQAKVLIGLEGSEQLKESDLPAGFRLTKVNTPSAKLFL